MKRKHVTRFIHIRVPGDPTQEELDDIRTQYLEWNVRSDNLHVGIIDIDVDHPYLVGAAYSRTNMLAGDEVSAVAEKAHTLINSALPNSDLAVLVTAAKFVVVVEHQLDGKKVVNHTDNREAMERANTTIFDRSMWEVNTFWRIKNWCWPRLVVYDYDGHDGRLVWSWVFHIGPFWIIRNRYAL